MAGRGIMGEVPEIVNERCFVLRWGLWCPMIEPINPDDMAGTIHRSCGVSLAASFADDYAAYSAEEVGLIPCANGGTAIQQWQPGTNLYDQAVFYGRLAMRDTELAGILWHQGEQNAMEQEDAEAHCERTRHALTSLRKDLGAEHIPLLIGELGEFTVDTLPYRQIVNDGLKRLAGELPNSAFVSAAGLTGREDRVHFDSKSLRTFGHRYFDAYRVLVSGKRSQRGDGCDGERSVLK